MTGGSYGDIYWAEGAAFRPLTEEETAPISPDVDPVTKKVVVNLTYQTLSCFEGSREVYFCRVHDQQRRVFVVVEEVVVCLAQLVNVRLGDLGLETDVPPQYSLLEYLHGRRVAPAWAVGEAAFHYEGQAGKRLGNVQTVVLAERKDASSVLEALRSGRAYCRLRTDDENLGLDRFQVASPQAEAAEAGGRLTLRPGDQPEVHAVIESATGRRLTIEVRLIRSGSVVQTLRAETPVTLRWTEPPLAPNARLYYRLEARGPAGLRVLSNPIFVLASQERGQ